MMSDSELFKAHWQSSEAVMTSVCALLTTVGCAVEVDETNDFDGVLQKEQALDSDTAFDDYPAAVRIMVGGSGCSAAMIAPDAMLTAAHCIESGFQRLRAEAFIDGERKCITSLGVDKERCSPNDFEWVRVTRDPHFKGGIDPQSDLAVVVLPSSGRKLRHFEHYIPYSECSYWSREHLGKPSCFFRVYTDSLKVTRNATAYGFGLPNVGEPRQTDARIRRLKHHHFQMDAEDSNESCAGDSGGPAAGDKEQLETVDEILLGNLSTGPGDCHRNGSYNRTRTKVWLIEQGLAAGRLGEKGREEGDNCRSKKTGSGHSAVKCWHNNDY